MSTAPDLFPACQLLDWLPGETLFSLLSRQHLLSGEVIAARTSERFFGSSRAGSHHDFPNRLAAFVERTNGQLGGLPGIALNRTLLAFYRAFIPSQECTHAIECMRTNSVAHLKLRLGVLTSRFRAHHPLKACPACMKEDSESTGWAYWHLEHQYPGVWVCTKHQDLLLVSKFKATGVQRFQWLLPRSDELSCEQDVMAGHALSDRLLRLAKLIESLVRGGVHEPIPTHLLYQVYRDVIASRGWLTASGSLRMRAISQEFLEQVRPLRLVSEFAGLPQTVDEARAIVGRLLRPPRAGTHPLRHILMIEWLFADMETFYQAIRNVGAIKQVSVPSCTDAIDRTTDPRKAELQRLLVEEKHSARATAKILGIDTQTALLWAEQRGVPVSRRAKKLSGELRAVAEHALQCGADKKDVELQTGLSASTVTRMLLADSVLHEKWLQTRAEQARKRSRAAWIAVLESSRGEGVKWMRSLEPGVYAWLYRHDRVWLDAHKPETANTLHKIRRSSVDWDTRDVELSAAVRSAALRLMSEGGGRRIFFWQLYQLVPELKTKRSVLHRLPLTRDAIDAALKAEPPARRNLWGE